VKGEVPARGFTPAGSSPLGEEAVPFKGNPEESSCGDATALEATALEATALEATALGEAALELIDSIGLKVGRRLRCTSTEAPPKKSKRTPTEIKIL
jgi:hypothetical protein